MRVLKTFVFIVAPLAVAIAAAHSAVLAAQQAAPKTLGFDITALDRSVEPCVDFYQFACGGWRAKNPIPPDRSSWGRFDEIAERNNEALHQILERAAASGAGRNAVEQKIGDYYGACMDEAAANKKGAAPLKEDLSRIDALTSKDALPAEIARLHGVGVFALFKASADQDFKDATAVIAAVDQGGIALPERDYYLGDDPRSVDLRKQYLAHVQKMFELVGDPAGQASVSAATVMLMETALAKASMETVKRREPANVYHMTPLADLQASTPAFAWSTYLSGIGAPPVTKLNVAVPEFFKGANDLVLTYDLADWKVYLRWSVIHANAALLSSEFVNENFNFFGKALTGARELRVRWKRCVQYTDGDLGEALGQPYVAATFGEQGKARMLKMVHALESALERDIKDLPWMTPTTKEQALIKLHAIANKIGYPDKWRDYSTLTIARDDPVGNSRRANAFEFKRQLTKIGKPVDRQEWLMTPPTVNAYYNPQLNDINFPAGILQPPFFDNAMDDAVNFGAIGAVIGHELTHGFDDQGRQFDAKGNLRDWWTAEDGKEFEKRASCVADQYSEFTAVDDLKLNGKLTLGENVADNGGVRIAYMALMDALANRTSPPVDGFTPEQRVFLGWGQIWCENRRDEFSRMLVKLDPHSPGRFRINGVMSNMPEFAKAFGCNAGQPMAPGAACRVW